MSISRTKTARTATFNVGGVELYHHYARDSHGVTTNTYMADSHIVTKEEFYKIIQDSLKGAERYIAQALGMIRV